MSTTSPKLNGADYLLILFYLPGGECTPIEGKTRITKMMFLFNKEIYPKLNLAELTPVDKLPQFEAYNYGPFSRDVHEQLYLFRNIGFLGMEEKQLNNASDEADLVDDALGLDEEDESQFVSGPLTIERYLLLDQGKNFVREKLLPYLKDDQIETLTLYKKRITQMRLQDLLSYVYRKYPEYAVNSLIKDKVMKNV
jgi:uncharacterized protein